jgi:hypothetical protein
MKGKTREKADGLHFNHNQTLVKVPKPSPSLRVKTHIKAGTLEVQGIRSKWQSLLQSL